MDAGFWMFVVDDHEFVRVIDDYEGWEVLGRRGVTTQVVCPGIPLVLPCSADDLPYTGRCSCHFRVHENVDRFDCELSVVRLGQGLDRVQALGFVERVDVGVDIVVVAEECAISSPEPTTGVRADENKKQMR